MYITTIYILEGRPKSEYGGGRISNSITALQDILNGIWDIVCPLDLFTGGLKMSRDKEYVEDSTKGKSRVNPLNYKGDVLVQVWVDSRVLATLCNWLDRSGYYPNYMSQVVRKPLEAMVELLIKEGGTQLVDNTIEARDMLQKRFKVDLSRGGRGTKNVMHNVELSIRREELAEVIQREKRIDDIQRPLRANDNPLAEEAIKKYHELFPNAND